MQLLKTPIIGVTLDNEPPGGYSQMPWYALRENYGDSLSRNGAAPLMLPHIPEAAQTYLNLIDGLVITGGNFDIDPSIYGDSTTHETVITKPRRTQFEVAITEGALKRDMPILGICGGEQLLNVILKGTLVQHIPDSIEHALEHQQRLLGLEPGVPSHMIRVEEDTLLHNIVGKTEFKVNSSHHQAVKAPGTGVVINAYAPDGVVEGIEVPGKRFCLGVEWHPEYEACEEDKNILTAFIAACSDYAATK